MEYNMNDTSREAFESYFKVNYNSDELYKKADGEYFTSFPRGHLKTWQAAQAEQSALIAELVEALEACKYDCHTGDVIGIAEQALAKAKGIA